MDNQPIEMPAMAGRQFPFAASPDVLRSHEKDVYTMSIMAAEATSILRSLFGARFTHRHSSSVNRLTELLYLSLTTLLGRRTLGEEYCDVVQVEDNTLRLPKLTRRLAYIASVVFAPWALAKTLPVLRRKLRAKLERSIQRSNHQRQSRVVRVQEYILKHLDQITSPSPIYALSLAAFYFTGSYYHLAKRLAGLRYVFTRTRSLDQRHEGYELLGVLLVLQIMVQSILHVRQTLSEASSGGESTEESLRGGLGDTQMSTSTQSIAQTTQTPLLNAPRYDTAQESTMSWIPSGQQSKCTLCLEPFRDPSVTTCGHVFCWTCIQDWVREKAECPLCRQAILPQKILPLRS